MTIIHSLLGVVFILLCANWLPLYDKKKTKDIEIITIIKYKHFLTLKNV